MSKPKNFLNTLKPYEELTSEEVIQARLASHSEKRGLLGSFYNDILVFPPDEKTKTKQDFRRETDLNLIVPAHNLDLSDYAYLSEQLVTDVRNANLFTDFAYIDVYTAVNQINQVKEIFGVLPAKTREQFNNDPMVFLEFASKQENHKQLEDMGLLDPIPNPSSPVSTSIVQEAKDSTVKST